MADMMNALPDFWFKAEVAFVTSISWDRHCPSVRETSGKIVVSYHKLCSCRLSIPRGSKSVFFGMLFTSSLSQGCKIWVGVKKYHQSL